MLAILEESECSSHELLWKLLQRLEVNWRPWTAVDCQAIPLVWCSEGFFKIWQSNIDPYLESQSTSELGTIDKYLVFGSAHVPLL